MAANLTVLVSMHDSRRSMAASRRMRSLIAELEARGHDTVELCPHTVELPDRAGTLRSPAQLATLLGNTRPIPIRSVGELLYAAWAIVTLLRLRPRQVFVTVPYVPAALVAVLAPRVLRGCRVVLEIRDLTWEYVAASDSRLLSVVSGVSRRLVAKAAKSAAHVVCTTDGQRACLARLAPEAEVSVVRNGVANDVLRRLATIASTPSPAERRPLILYAGTLGYAQDPAQLEALARAWPEADLLAVGSGVKGADLATRSADLLNVRVIDAVPFDALVQLYAQASVLISCLRHGPEFETAVPSKLYEYAATGRVVAFVGPGEAQQVTRSLGGVASDVIDASFVRELQNAVADASHKFVAIPTREAAASETADLLAKQH